ncbi:uncharacterized protein LOC113233861 [Hyposmocoma kahamanoa]|uniref:uncharacterized protein LOC113233861 n=1 Tax=Hyposmocoma kahamanoa TaxID=1477025 RepID=UPI000E6D6322|nr:uncharacterized protein LOC113233861 [Hyposmocoma kahamanoa]XP_026324870.1 uncharacterized protein LOC113233861 [Hyposmocoma kahamanoa]XP_026324871.1 uncharacterized protein LOC113233861 [Hyposmocoma kahamanoa]
MSCFDDIICFIEDMIEFLICIITQSIITCALTVFVLMISMMYLKRHDVRQQTQGLGTSLINFNAEGTGPMPTSTGTSGPHSWDGLYLPYQKVPDDNLNSFKAVGDDTRSHLAKDYSTIGMSGNTKSGTNGATSGGTYSVRSRATYGAPSDVTHGTKNKTMNGTTSGATNGATNGAAGVAMTNTNSGSRTQTSPRVGTSQTGADTEKKGRVKKLPLTRSCESCTQTEHCYGAANLCRSYSYTSCCRRTLNVPSEDNYCWSNKSSLSRRETECDKCLSTRNGPSRKTVPSLPTCSGLHPNRSCLFVKTSTQSCCTPPPCCRR